MRGIWCALCVTGLLVASAGRLWSGDEATLRGLIAKAIDAQGGEAKLAKYKAITVAGTGKLYLAAGEGLPFTAEWTFQGPDHQRFSAEVKAMGQTFKIVKVLNGDKGWQKTNDGKTTPMDKGTLEEEKAQQYGSWVATLLPLKGKAFKFEGLGEMKVGDRDTVGVRVTRAGRRDVNLYFDKANHLLLKMEMRIKMPGGDMEQNQEWFYENYKDIDGAKQAMKAVVKRDGKLYVEGEFSEVRGEEKVDASTFAEP